MFDFSGRRAVVTGGTRGIGGAVSAALLQTGAEVVAVYAGNDSAAEEFKRTHDGDGRLTTCKLNVSDAAECEAFWRDVSAERPVHILVNSAGIRRDAVLAMMGEDDWRQVLDVNLTGTFHMCKFGVRAMMTERYGRIINITSPSGKFGFEGQANYAASKAGMVALTRSLSKETAKRKITVNCVSPGFIDTDLIRDLPDDLAKQYRSSVPLKRFGTPEEVAHSVLFLASDLASYITGATLEVTGGL